MSRRTSGSSGRATAGFTLVELLVVVAITGLLVALLLPAVQAARESGRRAQCSSQLRQFGLACAAFEDARQFWPPGAIAGGTATEAHKALRLSPGPEHGWVVFLLPYLEQQPLRDAYDFGSDWRSPANRLVRETRLSVAQCPSTPTPERMDSATSGGFTWRAAPTDYGAVNGVTTTLYGMGLIDYATSRNPAGMLRVNQIQPSSEMVDGTSNQLVVAEDAGRPFRYVARRKSLFGGRYTGAGWADRANEYLVHGATYDGLTLPGPCPVNCSNNNEIYSFHPGGALTLFGDGSVRFLAQSTEMRVVAALTTRFAGESVVLP